MLKNRIAAFEYLYYPGHYLAPYSYLGVYRLGIDLSNEQNIRVRSSGYQWRIHDCGNYTVCLESRKPDWNRYYATSIHNSRSDEYQGTLYYNGFNNPWKIHCTLCSSLSTSFDKCVLGRPDIDIGFMYSDSTGHSLFSYDDPEDWYTFRIIATDTEQYWNEVALSKATMLNISIALSMVLITFLLL